MKERLQRIVKPLRNKYILSISVFLLWLIFFDNHNLIDRLSYYRDIINLKIQKDYYLEKIEVDRQKLNELKTNSENLEKFAREQYLMKKDKEDIYLIDED